MIASSILMVLGSYLIEMLKNIQNTILSVGKSSKVNLCPMKDYKSSYSDFGPPTLSMELAVMNCLFTLMYDLLTIYSIGLE